MANIKSIKQHPILFVINTVYPREHAAGEVNGSGSVHMFVKNMDAICLLLNTYGFNVNLYTQGNNFD